MKCMIVGATNVDTTLHLERPLRLKDKNPVTVQESLGGVGFNIAMGLSKLVENVHFLTAYDGENEILNESFQHLITLSVKPQPRFIGVMNEANVEVAFSAMEALDTFSIRPFQEILQSLSAEDLVCFDLNFSVDEIIEMTQCTPARVFIEATSAHKIEKLKDRPLSLAGLKMNLLEAEILTGSTDLETVQRTLEAMDIQTIIVTLGKEGVMIFEDRFWTHYQDQHPWQSTNDSGIGDAFMAGYLAGLMQGDDPVKNAFTMSYLTAQSATATAPAVTLKNFIKERKKHDVNVIRRRPRSTG